MADTVLELVDLSKRFGRVAAVTELSLLAEAGEVLGLLGPNGAGKTTTIRMVCGELAPDSGQILLGGRRLLPNAEGRASIGLCPQELVVWSRLTCAEQLEFVGEMYGLRRSLVRERAATLLAALDLTGKAKALGATLSGGMARRLNLALALVHDPQLVVLDEPGAGLDPRSRVLVRDFIRSLAKDKAVVLTTHDMDEAERVCDRVAIVDHGRLLVHGTPEELKRSVRRPAGEDGGEGASSTGRGERSPSLEDVFLALTGRALRS